MGCGRKFEAEALEVHERGCCPELVELKVAEDVARGWTITPAALQTGGDCRKGNRIAIAESGFSEPEHVREVAGLADAVLVGSALMSSADSARLVRELRQ